MWQEIIVGICVVAAALFLLRHWFSQKTSACGGCNNCSTTKCTNPPDKNSEKLL